MNVEGRRYRFNPFFIKDKVDGREAVALSDFTPDEQGEYVELPLVGWGRFTGNLIEAANQETILENLLPALGRGLWIVPSAFSYTGLMVKPSALSDEELEYLVDAQAALEQYPLLDEDCLSRLKQEAIDAAWDVWLMSDLKSQIEDLMFRADLDIDLDLVDQDELRFWFFDLAYNGNDRGQYIEFINDASDDIYVDLENAVSYNDLLSTKFMSRLKVRYYD